MIRVVTTLVAGLMIQQLLLGQNLVPNPSFESGNGIPDAWLFNSSGVELVNMGRQGGRAVSLGGHGAALEYCRTIAGVPITPNQAYVLRFWGMTTNAIGLGAAAQLESAGGRRRQLCEKWSPYALALVTGTNVDAARLILNQYGNDGPEFLDDVELRPALPVHARVGGRQFGVGESASTNGYRFETRFQEFSGSYSRCLYQHNSQLGSDEWSGFWSISASGFAAYHHAIPDLMITNARVKATVSFSFGGDLVLEASTNGSNWLEVGRLMTSLGGTLSPLEISLPATLLPATDVFVRFSATNTLYLSGYEFEASVPEILPEAHGATWFWEVEVPGNVARPAAMTNSPLGHRLTLALLNPDAVPHSWVVRCLVEGAAGTREVTANVSVPAQVTNEVEIELPSAGVGENMAHLEIRDAVSQAVLQAGKIRFMVSALQNDSFGGLLSSTPEGELWWCGSTYKVSRERLAPTATASAIQIHAARNEYEPFQLILRPAMTLTNVHVAITDFAAAQLPGQPTIAATNVTVDLVDYVNVTRPTDTWGAPGWHPDPLVPLTGSFLAPEQLNQPLWFTVHVPRETPPGDYLATVTLQATGFSASVPVQLHVFRFALSDVTHTWTAYHADIRTPWHNMTNVLQRQKVWDLYLDNFRRHRISPYGPHLFSPIDYYSTNGQFVLDYARFDQAMERYLGEFNFSGFNLLGLKAPPLPSTLNDYLQFTPEYTDQLRLLMQPMMQHLRQRGWADLAYCFWKDEPQPSEFEFVSSGMKAIQSAAPGLRRVVTAPPAPALIGDVEMWSPQFALYRYFDVQRDLAQRMVAGDAAGWYLCLAPTAPRPNNFIDHPAINHRIRFWLAQRYGITNDLYWNTTWYGGPDLTLRNPWEDPMSVSGTNIYLGNGDGMLLYPPTRTPPAGTLIAGPINSLRWELLREGLEDAEYFWLLTSALERAELQLGLQHPAVKAGVAALQVVNELAPAISAFELDPERLQQARLDIAQSIEALDDGSPNIVRPPRSQAVELGDTLVLRGEALGWPPPTYQWRRNGYDLPGATQSTFVLTNCGLFSVGEFTLIASNSVGTAVSAPAEVVGLWSTLPKIITGPASQVRLIGERAVLTGAGAGTEPLTYYWYRDGGQFVAGPLSEPVLLLTNLLPSQAGEYRLVVSNGVGQAISAPAQLTVLLPITNSPLVKAWGDWLYDDSGHDLGTAWRQVAFDDSHWTGGSGLFAYGQDFWDTLIGGGRNPQTVYFRRHFALAELGSLMSLGGMIVRDDGAVVYLNGEEIFRNNMPEGQISYSTSATGWVEGNSEWEEIPFTAATASLHLGDNVVAVELHQNTNGPSAAMLPVARWSFEETNAPFIDTLGGNDFNKIGEGVLTGPGRFGGGVSNGGQLGSYLSTADGLNLSFSGPFTVGGWFRYVSGTVSPATCLEKTGEFRLYYTGTGINRYRFELNGVSLQDNTSGTAPAQWRFIVAWYDGTNANIQVDLGTVYSTPVDTPPTATTNPVVALRLVNNGGGLSGDEIFFYKRLLTAAERSSRFFNQPEGANEPPDMSFNFALEGTFGQIPQILNAPTRLVRQLGETAAFTVAAASLTPMAYQWNFRGAPLLGETNRLLFLPNVTLADAGDYSVTIGNSVGEMTSASAPLVVEYPQELRTHLVSDNKGWILEVPGYGLPVTIFTSTNLIDWSEWVHLPASASSTNIVDSASANSPTRFYQLRLSW